MESFGVFKPVTPMECRLRNLSYSAPIFAKVEYTVAKKLLPPSEIVIGRMPIMLGSSKCLLSGTTYAQMAKLGECPIDPGKSY